MWMGVSVFETCFETRCFETCFETGLLVCARLNICDEAYRTMKAWSKFPRAKGATISLSGGGGLEEFLKK